MVIGTALGWSNGATIALAVVLAFFFGYALTLRPLLSAMSFPEAVRLALAADTASITVMEMPPLAETGARRHRLGDRSRHDEGRRYAGGRKSPQHVVPSYDLQTRWVTNNAEHRTDGSLTPIDPRTGKAGKSIAVDDPYNMYFTPDGKSAIVVAEARRRLDFRSAHHGARVFDRDAEMRRNQSCRFSIDGRFAIFTCEFDGALAKIDLTSRKVLGYLKLKMPATRYKAPTWETSAPMASGSGCRAATTTWCTASTRRRGRSRRSGSAWSPRRCILPWEEQRVWRVAGLFRDIYRLELAQARRAARRCSIRSWPGAWRRWMASSCRHWTPITSPPRRCSPSSIRALGGDKESGAMKLMLQ